MAHNLPSRLTSFVGREREIAEVTALIRADRLVTLVGAPGVGKTRLSLQCALAVHDAFPDGVWLVELAPLADPDLVPHAVADVLGVREQPGRILAATLASYLRTRRPLLLLDNCEHLIVAAATLAETLLQSCPRLHVLATSREPLAIEGETVHRAPSLTISDPKRSASLPPSPSQGGTVGVGGGGLSGSAAADSEAVRLFAERARAASPTFTLTDRTTPIVAQICARLDGIPLAIELAAARVRALSLEQIASRLDARFRLLTGGSRTALPRQQTLRGAVDWSYDLLSESEQALLRHLAVFAGGFTLDAAEHVGSSETLVSLVDKSLVQVEETDGGGDGERRYRLLETFRQYGHEKLVEYGELSAARDRHRDYFLTLVEEAQPHLTGTGQKGALARLEREHDNLRVALGWCLKAVDRDGDAPPSAPSSGVSSQPDLAVRLVGGLWRFWWIYGHHAEGRRWLALALAVPPSDHTPAGLSARASASQGAAHLAQHEADFRSAILHAEDALTLWRQSGNHRGTTMGLQRLGLYLVHVGDAARGLPLCEESIVLARRIRDPLTLAMSVHALAVASFFVGQPERSLALSEESLALCRQIGYAAGISFNLRFLSRSVSILGDPARATQLLEEALTISQELGDKGGVAEAYKDLAHAARLAADPGRAIDMLRISIRAHRELAERWLIAMSLHDLAGVMTLRGAHSLQASTPALPTGASSGSAARGDLLAGVRIFGAAEALRETCNVTLPVPLRTLADGDLAVLREHLDDDDFERAWDDGHAMSFEQAVEYALALIGAAAPDSASDRPTTTTGPGGRGALDPKLAVLTPREREVVASIVQGLTNRQIAETLVLSERTVDTHVHNVLGKLQRTSRAQIAVWAVEHGLGGTQ